MRCFVLLALCSLLTSVTTIAAAPDEASLDKLHWRLACQAYTFREMSAFETIDLLKRLGIRYVEFYPGQKLSPDRSDLKVGPDLPADQIARLKEKLKDTGIEAISFGVTDLPNDEAVARKTFEFARSMGIKTIVSEPPQHALPLLDRLAAEYDIRVAIHNHPKPKSIYWNCDTLLDALNDRSPRIGACADVGHWYRSDLVPVECLKKLEGHIIESHFKDLSPEKLDVPWGTGRCDARGMLAEFKRQGRPMTIVIEYESTKGQELIDNVTRCVDNLNTIARELSSAR
jgi:sugar phosphate isomerase/epimerase